MTTVDDAHIDDLALAGLVLDQDRLTLEQQSHLRMCSRCRQAITVMRAVTDVAGNPPELAQPSAPVWQRIEEALQPTPAAEFVAVNPSDNAATQVHRASSAPPAVLRRRRLRRGLAIGVAAMLGVIAGVLGTITVNGLDNRDQVVEAVRLSALPGKSGDGAAQLIKTNGVAMLRVAVDVPTGPGTFHELWLINRDGRRMQDLGVLPPSGQATYPLPPVLQNNLRGYTVVDVSIEPFDGNPAHSHNSVVRGQLAG